MAELQERLAAEFENVDRLFEELAQVEEKHAYSKLEIGGVARGFFAGLL